MNPVLINYKSTHTQLPQTFLTVFRTWGLFQHLGNVYFIFHMFSGMFGENRSLKWIHVICHTRNIPQNEKFAKKRLVKIMLRKIEAVFSIVFKPDYNYFLYMLVSFKLCPTGMNLYMHNAKKIMWTNIVLH